MMTEHAGTAKGASTTAIACRQCNTPNEPPFIFCHNCGAARVSLNRYQILTNLTLAMVAFTSVYYYAELISWGWPIYALYSLLILQFSLLLVIGSRARTFRVGTWLLTFLAAFGVLFHYMNSEGPQIFVYLLEDLPAIIRQHPWESIGVITALLLLPAALLYQRWGRVYGWVNAYRIVILGFIGLSIGCLIGLQLLQVATANGWFPSLQGQLTRFTENVKPQYMKAIGVAAATFLRIFLFEIFVFAAVRGYRIASKGTHAKPQDISRESGFVRSLFSLAQMARVFAAALENMMTYLLETIIVLARDVWRVFTIACREVFLPTIALVTCALLLHHLTNTTQDYIAHNSVRSALLIGAGITAILLCQLLFLICKTSFRPSRVVDFHVQMLGWLLPNLLVFFLLVSLSLFAMTEALNSNEDRTHSLPFTIGMLTKFFGVALIALIAFILARKRSLFTMRPPSEIAERERSSARLLMARADAQEDREDDAPEDDGLAALEASINSGAPSMATGPTIGGGAGGSLFARRRNRNWNLTRSDDPTRNNDASPLALASKLKNVVIANPLSSNALKAMDSLQDRVKGRPEIVQRVITAKQQYAEKYYQWEALERTRDSITAETYRGLREGYLAELNALLSTRDQLQAELDRLYAMQMVEKNMLDIKISALRSKKDEFEHLRSVGALAEKDLKTRVAPLEAELKMELARLQTCEQKLDFLRPEATAYNDIKETAPPPKAP